MNPHSRNQSRDLDDLFRSKKHKGQMSRKNCPHSVSQKQLKNRGKVTQRNTKTRRMIDRIARYTSSRPSRFDSSFDSVGEFGFRGDELVNRAILSIILLRSE